MASSLGVDLACRACLGADTGHVLGRQVEALGAHTAYVSITVGGNAAGFLADAIGAAATGAGVGVVDVRDAFGGHAVCDPAEWVNGVAWPVEASFHPSPAGHAAYARLVASRLGVADLAPGEMARGATPVAVVAGPETQGPAPTFALPDLLSERSLRGAAEHGLDAAEVERLARLVQQPGAAPAAGRSEAWARPHELDARVSAGAGRGP